MKPNFALNLSHEGISLLHRAKTGWLRVGDVGLDAPDLDAQLNLLRKTAADLETGGLTTKLVIPNSQILYTEIDAPGPDTAARISQIRDGLVGLTPYDVAELVFDWRMAGKRAKVAVVARDTLSEAETFATKYRFNPVSFVAVPDNGAFAGEPFFGPTRHASTLLVDGEVVEPDPEQIAVLGSTGAAGKSRKRRSENSGKTAGPTSHPPDEPPAAEPPAARFDPDIRPDPAHVTDPDLAVPAVTFASRRKQGAAPAPRAGAVRAEPRISFEGGRGGGAASAAVTATSLDLDPPERPNVAERARFTFDIRDDAPPNAGTALYAIPKGEETPADGPAAKAVTAPGQSGPASGAIVLKTPMPMTAPHTADVADPKEMAAERRRQARQKAKDAGAAMIGTIGKLARSTSEAANHPSKPGIAAAASEAEALTVFGARGRVEFRERPKYLGLFLTLLMLLALAVLALWSTYFMNDVTSGLFGTVEEEPQIAAPSVIPQPQPVLPDPVVSEPVVSDPVVSEPIVAEPVVSESVVAEPVAEPADTVPAVAAPAEIETADPVPAPAATPADAGAEIATPEPDPVTNPEPDVTLPFAPTEAAADAAPDAGADPADAGTEIAALPAPEPAPEPEPAPPVVPDPIISAPERQPPPSPAEAEARYAASGIWQLDPEPLVDVPGGGDQLEDIYIASIDPQVSVADAVALPGAQGLDTDRRPPVLNPPAPLGTRFDLDERGLVRPTAEGALNPDGVPVYSGAPPVVPGPRPSDLEVPVDETRLLQDERLLASRPALRPGGLSEANERARLGGFSSDELAAIRPRARPLELAPRGSVFDTAQEETQAAAVDPVFIGEDVTALAVAASRAPPVRPSNFSRVVERALAEATRAPPTPLPEKKTEVLASATVAAPRMPPVPSRASVAKQATVRNAINLGKVNLIGIYGSPSKRRALVRLSSGKYVKVEVGDRVDGGRVSAIGSNELRYVKRGRNITLKMPKG